MIERTQTSALAVVLAALAVSCGPSGGGPSRPGSDRQIDCPTSGSDLQYGAKFTPGIARSPTDSLYVTFTGRRPSDAEAAAVLQACVNATVRAVRVDYDMLATAWFNQEGPLALPDGSANLTYDPKTGTTKSWTQRAASIPSTSAARPGYTVEARTHKPAPTYGSSVTLDVIFERPPASAEVLKVLVAEMTTAVGKQTPKVNTVAYPRSGPVGEQGGRPQVRGANGAFLVAHFDAKTGEIRDQDGRVLGTIK